MIIVLKNSFLKETDWFFQRLTSDKLQHQTINHGLNKGKNSFYSFMKGDNLVNLLKY